jgi:hypothetical protein
MDLRKEVKTMEETELSIWEKKADDLTVSDSLKIGVGITVVTAVAMVAVPLAIGGVMTLVEKIRKNHQTKKEVKTLEEAVR